MHVLQQVLKGTWQYIKRKLEKKKLPFAIIFQLQKTFVTKNYLIALDKFHKTLIASVDEVNN